MSNKPLSRHTNIVVQDLEHEILIYDLNSNRAFCLNETARLVYQLSDGTKTVSEISAEMSTKLKTLVSEELIWLTIEKLEKDNLLEEAGELFNYFKNFSRRELVKKVGLSTMVALPIIASVIAPSALQAQSVANTTCILPRCVAAGLDWCAGCAGQRVLVEVNFSTNGTCSDRGFRPESFPYTCTAGQEIAPDNDLRIVSLSVNSL